jgi:hypothetical protein
MNRNHIHFAAGEPGENGVISGEWNYNSGISTPQNLSPNYNVISGEWNYEF